MANPQKAKGDRNERAAVAELGRMAPDLILTGAGRMLSAGRRHDVGDLAAFPDVAVQVRALSDMGRALRSAAADTVTQARHAGIPLGLGMVPVPRARAGTVRWLASCRTGRRPLAPDPAVAVFGNPAAAITHLRRDDLGIPRHRRIVLLVRRGTDPVYVAPVEAWLHSYRILREQSAASGPGHRPNRTARFGPASAAAHVPTTPPALAAGT